MEIIPHFQIYKFLKRLQEDQVEEHNSEIQPAKSTDLFAAQNNKFNLYNGTNKDIKIFLQNKGYIGSDGKISIEGRIFLTHYTSWWKQIDLWIKDYPMFLSALFSLIAILISILALMVSYY